MVQEGRKEEIFPMWESPSVDFSVRKRKKRQGRYIASALPSGLS
jgi:hypothetical protein